LKRGNPDLRSQFTGERGNTGTFPLSTLQGEKGPPRDYLIEGGGGAEGCTLSLPYLKKVLLLKGRRTPSSDYGAGGARGEKSKIYLEASIRPPLSLKKKRRTFPISARGREKRG